MRLFLTAFSCLLAFGAVPAAAEPEAQYCAVFNPSNATLHIPCLTLGRTPYQATLGLTSADPIQFGVQSVGASTLEARLGQCAVFDAATNSVGLPCVVVGGNRLWAKLMLNASSLNLTGGGGSVPNQCERLADNPASAQVRVVATGEASGTVARATIRNQGAQQQCYCVFSGHALRNSDSGQQDLGIMKSASLCLAPNAQGDLDIDGSCINAERTTPAPGQAMTVVRDARPDLHALLQAIERERTDMAQIPIITFAVWALTDASNPLSGTLTAIKQIYTLAGLDPATYPGLEREIQIPTFPTFPGAAPGKAKAASANAAHTQ